jgi:hypothetical protein
MLFYPMLGVGDTRSSCHGLELQPGHAWQPKSQQSAAKLKFLGAGKFVNTGRLALHQPWLCASGLRLLGRIDIWKEQKDKIIG